MLCTLADLKTCKAEKLPLQRLLGIDLGDKTVGLSLSDTTWTIASPYQTLIRSSDKQAISGLQTVIKEFSIAAIVMGYPLNMNGSAGPQSQPCGVGQGLLRHTTSFPRVRVRVGRVIRPPLPEQ